LNDLPVQGVERWVGQKPLVGGGEGGGSRESRVKHLGDSQPTNTNPLQKKAKKKKHVFTLGVEKRMWWGIQKTENVL